MFLDYYAILNISKNANEYEIKSAFKIQAKKWHPDKNRGIDTTKRMQEINEAFLILKDKEAKKRYDIEYENFKKKTIIFKNTEQSYSYNEYNVKDEVLKGWMQNAKKQAIDLAKQTITLTSVGLKAGFVELTGYIKFQIIFGVIILFIILLFKLF